ncbi:MAG: LysR family transcriptional regulator for bpeEF and oprC [Psychromonas sp.]|jgi:LysR family transcriptional regulator for bpeEF and oprC
MNRKIDLVEEGVDLAVRVGHLADSSMVARKIGSMPLKTVASMAYFEQHGRPEHPKALAEHNCLINTAISTPKRWTYQVAGKTLLVKVSGELEANESLCLKAFAMVGQGIAQMPNFYVDNAIASQELIEILAEYAPQPLPINLIYPSQRLLNPALIDFLMDYMD